MQRRTMLAGMGAAGWAMMTRESRAADETAANTAVVKRYIDEVVNAGKTDVVDAIIAPDYQGGEPGSVRGRDALKQRLADNAAHRDALVDDGRYVIDDLIAAGELVAGRLHFAGRAKRTGQPVTALVLLIAQLVDGQIVALWQLADNDALAEQL